MFTFTEEILNLKLPFLCSGSSIVFPRFSRMTQKYFEGVAEATTGRVLQKNVLIKIL